MQIETIHWNLGLPVFVEKISIEKAVFNTLIDEDDDTIYI